MTARTLLLISALLLGPGVSRAEAVFTGADAALIDWGVKNCSLKSTEAEHKLVDAATTKGRDAFQREYLKQFESEAFKGAAADKAKSERLCRNVKEWYGRSGTRIPSLLAGEGESLSGSPTSQSTKSKDGGGKGGRGGRHRGGSRGTSD